MKPIRLSAHAAEQAKERGATHHEVVEAILNGNIAPAKLDRSIARYNFPFNAEWNEFWYAIKQVAPVFIEKENEIVVITVYTFYF